MGVEDAPGAAPGAYPGDEGAHTVLGGARTRKEGAHIPYWQP